MQRRVAERNEPIPAERRLQFRIGVHQGDIVVEGDDILGDGVNIAARLEALAEPGGICVSARVQEDAAGRLDLAFEDQGEQALKNIARKVRVYSVPLARLAPTALGTLSRIAGEGGLRRESDRLGEGISLAPALPDKPSTAVLPFANMSGDPEQEYFVDGMVEEIITALSRIHWLFVIARYSSFTYKGRAVDAQEIGRELGVRYMLEGSVRKAGQRVRITAQLIDAADGAHLWADRFEGSLADVFELQDQVAASVAGVIEPALQAAEIRRAAHRPTADLTAYDFYLRALAGVWAYSPERIIQGLGLLDQAIAREPRFGPALALAASYRVDLDNTDAAEDPDANKRVAIELARQALRVGADDPGVLGRAAIVLGGFGEDIDAALALIDRALALNPSFADGWYHSGWLRLLAGELAVAIAHFENSLRLNPRGQRGFHLSGIGTAQFLLRRFDDAAAMLRVSLEELPNFTPTYRALMSCYAHMGRLEAATQIAERLRTLTPLIVRSARAFRNPEHRELYLSGLRLAMGEKG